MRMIVAMLVNSIVESSDDSSSDDDDEIFLMDIRGPLQRRPRIENYLQIIHIYNDNEFKSHFR